MKTRGRSFSLYVLSLANAYNIATQLVQNLGSTAALVMTAGFFKLSVRTSLQ